MYIYHVFEKQFFYRRYLFVRYNQRHHRKKIQFNFVVFVVFFFQI